jgi:hypothetical protein
MNANLHMLTGGVVLKQRVQHPKVNECKDRGTPYWFFRYRDDELLADGTVKTSRKRPIIGTSKGENAIGKKQPETARDRFFAERNSAPSQAEAAVAAKEPPQLGAILFGKLADLWRSDFVDRTVGAKALIAASTKGEVHQPPREPHPSPLEGHPARRVSGQGSVGLASNRM